MAISFSDLKKSRGKDLEILTKKIEQINSPNRESFGDERFWSPVVDKAGNGYAVIRFLPAGPGEDYPWISYFDHGFQGPTSLWYIENSLTSIGKEDPVSAYNTKLWNTGIEANKDLARKQKRRLHYVSNIYVVSDSANPENEGKRFLFKYGKKIFQKLNEVMNPQFEDETPLNPFDFWEGANFKLKIRNFEGYRNYDKSEFEAPTPLSSDDKILEDIYSNLYKLQDFLAPSNYKTFEELDAKLKKVLLLEDDETPRERPTAPATSQVRKTVSEKAAYVPPTSVEDDDEVDTDFFRRLAED